MESDRIRCDEILKETMVSVGAKIKEERLNRNWDYLELVIKSRVNQQTIYNLENGLDCNPTIKTIINLSDALGFNLFTLLA